MTSSSPRFARRQLLRGAGGVVVGLPWLPSLLPAQARAATSGPPRLVMLTQKHGGWGSQLHGDVSARLPNKQALFAGHEISSGPMPASAQAGRTVITPILQADATALPPGLVAKMNVLRGLDSVAQGGHNEAMFGNVVTSDPSQSTPSIDQVAAWSPSYYKNDFRERALITGYSSASFNHASPATRSGPIQGVEGQGDPQRLWDRLFGNFVPPSSPTPKPTAPARKPLVDAVLSHYKLIRESNRRLSSDDRQRLDGHMQMLSELQRRVGSSGPLVGGMGCAKPARSTKSYGYNFVKESGGIATPPDQLRSPSESVALHQLYIDLIVAAFMCGITRIATVFPYEKNDPFSDYKDNWHTLAHRAGDDGAECKIMAQAYQLFFEKVVVDLARKLDVDDGTGRSYLDGSLILWTNEHADFTHNASDKLAVTFGGANGFFKTGLYVDYRNQAAGSLVGTRLGGKLRYQAGLPINQFWATLLLALGIPRSEWQTYSRGQGTSWGPLFVGNQGGSGKYALQPSHYVPGVFSGAGNPLPVITA